MCQPPALGGQRCAAHTRPAYREAHPGTRVWFTAAIYYATTAEGRTTLEADRQLCDELGRPTDADNCTVAIAIARYLIQGDINGAQTFAASKDVDFHYWPPCAAEMELPPISTHTLTDYDRLLLDVEAGRYPRRSPRGKLDLISEDFGLNATQFWQRINTLVDLECARTHDPATTQALAARRAARTALRAGPQSQTNPLPQSDR